jgi:cytosine/adenosine deaminase-related metal-dependent hydrolase
MFRTRPLTLHFPPDLDPLEAWRAAAQLVRARWTEYRAARREDRAGAFAAYTAALDAEAAAARYLRIVALAPAA